MARASLQKVRYACWLDANDERVKKTPSGAEAHGTKRGRVRPLGTGQPVGPNSALFGHPAAIIMRPDLLPAADRALAA